MKLKFISALLFSVLILGCSESQEDAKSPKETSHLPQATGSKLLTTILSKDSLLFEVGFNGIDTATVSKLITEDFEFYHDLHGITGSKIEFLNDIESLKELPFKTWRELEKSSIEIYPLYKDNGEILYGVIQNGVHHFYQQHKNQKEQKTSTARFTHLWIKTNDIWKLKRVLSYDHKTPMSN